MLFLRTFLAFRKEKTQEKKTMNCPFRTDEMKGLFKMRYSKKEFEKYPEIMNKEQLRKACHISKRTALFLLQFNLIPHTSSGKKTRCYAIKKSDVIAFMNDREKNPERYIAPDNWYRSDGSSPKPYNIRITPPLPNDKRLVRKYYECKLESFPEVVNVAVVSEFAGYDRRTVGQWIRTGKLKALTLPQKYVIPKCYLIDWLCSKEHNDTIRKSYRHVDMLWELSKWHGEKLSND